jgi:hypothetical protein
MSNENDKHNENSDQLMWFEQALRQARPEPPRIDRDRLMFLAGQASAESTGFGVQSSGGEREGANDVDGNSLVRSSPDFVLSTQCSVLSTECSPSIIHQSIAPTDNRRGNWFWPVSTAALAATSLALAIALSLRQQPREVIVYRDGPGPVMTTAAAPRDAGPSVEEFQVPTAVTIRPAVSRVPAENYLRTREVAVRMGLDAIGSQSAGPAFSAPQTYGDLLLGLAGPRREAEGAAERRENPANM